MEKVDTQETKKTKKDKKKELTVPPVEPTLARQPRKRIRKDVGKRAHDDRDHGKSRQALPDLVARVPAADQICATGQEARLEGAEQEPAQGQHAPALDEAHAQHDDAEAHAEEG